MSPLSSPTPMIDEGNSTWYDGTPLGEVPHTIGSILDSQTFEKMVSVGLPTRSLYDHDLYRDGSKELEIIFGKDGVALLSKKVIQAVIGRVSRKMDALFDFATTFLQKPPLTSLK